jgi:hypothetical protein
MEVLVCAAAQSNEKKHFSYDIVIHQLLNVHLFFLLLVFPSILLG